MVVEVHGSLEAVEVEFAKVILRDHSHANTFVALLLLGLLLLLLRDLKLGGVKVHELGLDIFLCGLGLRWDRCLLLLLGLLRGRCSLSSLLLKLVDVQSRWVGADVVDEWSECWVAKEGLDQATVALILLKNAGVFAAQVVGVLGLEGDLAFELTNVFCDLLV